VRLKWCHRSVGGVLQGCCVTVKLRFFRIIITAHMVTPDVEPPNRALLLQWCYSGVTVVLQSVTVVS
jgi:hypothetical protein